MRLIKATLKNICQHESLEAEFGNGITGILGANGSGKSNLVKMVKASLTNDFSVNPGVKDDNIRKGSGDENAVITTQWQHDNVPITIRRSLRPKRNRLAIGSATPLTRTADIAAELERVTGLNKRTINEYIFVDQWSIFAFLSQDPAERSKSFMHLCGVEAAEKVWELLGDRIRKDSPLAVDVVTGVDAIYRRIASRQRDIKASKKEKAEARKLLLTVDVGKIMKRRVEQWTRKESLGRTISTLLKTVAELESRLPLLRRNDAELAESIVLLEEKFGKLSEKIRGLREAEKTRKSIEEIEAVRRRYKAVLKRVAPIEPVKPEGYVSTERVRSERTSLQDEARALAEKLEILDAEGTVECPLCGTQVTNLLDHIEELRDRVGEIADRLGELKVSLPIFHQYEMDRDEYLRLEAAYASNMEMTRQELASLPAPRKIPESSLTLLTAIGREYDETKSRLADIRRKRENASSAYQQAQGGLSQAGGDLAKLRDENDAIDVTRDSAEEAEEILAKHAEARVNVRHCDDTIASLESMVAEEYTEAERLEDVTRRSETAKKWLADLESWREVVHRDSLPGVVTKHMLGLLVDSVNETLELFDGPFRVTAGKDLSFVAIKPDGTQEAASRLSGGEKVILAVAFRFAVSSLFAGNVGMMVLDEPTAGLDEHNIECLLVVLERVASITRERGRQLIIITHDYRLERIFDRTILLVK